MFSKHVGRYTVLRLSHEGKRQNFTDKLASYSEQNQVKNKNKRFSLLYFLLFTFLEEKEQRKPRPVQGSAQLWL